MVHYKMVYLAVALEHCSLVYLAVALGHCKMALTAVALVHYRMVYWVVALEHCRLVYLAEVLVHYMMVCSLVGCMFALVVDIEGQALEVAHMLVLVLACRQALDLQLACMLVLLEGVVGTLELLVVHKPALKLEAVDRYELGDVLHR